MSIFQTLKKALRTPEARHFKEEVVETATDVASRAKEAATHAVETTHAVAEEVRERIQGLIDYETFSRIDIRVGTIQSVEKIEKSDKLLKLMVDLGEKEPRQIISGISPYFEDPQSLAGRQAMFVANLEPRTIFGYQSQGMIFALNDEESFSILEPDTPITPGTKAS